MKIRFALLSIFLTYLPVSAVFAISLKQTPESQNLYENRNCQDLYREITELEIATLKFESSIYNTRNADVASVVSTMFSPAVFFVGYTKMMTFKTEIEASESSKELHLLRQRMAELRCFAN